VDSRGSFKAAGSYTELRQLLYHDGCVGGKAKEPVLARPSIRIVR
jgi:hypothetical protein